MKTILKGSVAAAALVAVASPAFAGNVVSGNDNFSVKLSGQFNKAVMYTDSGPANGVSIGDNNTSNTRIWITPTGTINEALTATGRLEIRTTGQRLSTTGISGSNGTSSDEGTGTQQFAVTESWLALSHKDLGSIQIGLGSEATDGAGETAYNPAGNAVDTGDMTEFDAIQVFTKGATGSNTSGLTVSSFFSNYNGGDTENVMYTTPSFAGFQAKVSSGVGETDGGLYYGGKFGGFAVQASVGYRDTSGIGSVDSVLTTAAGIKHDSGFSISGGYAKEGVEAANLVKGKRWYVIGGYEANLTSMGKTGFAVQYVKASDTTVVDDEGKMLSFGVEQGLATGVSVYAGAHFIEVQRSGTDYEDVTSFLAGAKVSF